MDNNKKPESRSRVLMPGMLQPVVRHANYFEVGKSGGVTRWGERTITDFELILTVSGECFYDARGQERVRLRMGDVLLIPPGEWHVFGKADGIQSTVISCIHCEMTPDGSWGAGDYTLDPAPERVTSMGDEKIIRDLFRRCQDVHLGYSPLRTEMTGTILKEIWLRLAERWIGGRDGLPEPSVRIRQMQHFLRDRMTGPVSRHDVAKAFCVTPEHVNYLFKRELGITPTYYLQRERIMRAYRFMREEGFSVKEAACRVGFEDVFYFSRVFKRIMHFPPARVRNL